MTVDSILGLTGTILSVVSLTWQVRSWRASGARLKVSCISSFLLGDVVPEMELLGIKIANSGRSSTIVNDVAFKLPDGKALQILNDEVGAVTLPYEIRPGEVITVYCIPLQLKESMQRQGYAHDTRIIPRVSSGHGDSTGKPIQLD